MMMTMTPDTSTLAPSANGPIERATEQIPQIVLLTSYPPRECGIATYSSDLLATLKAKFGKSFAVKVCALETLTEKYDYDKDVAYTLNTDNPAEFVPLAAALNINADVRMVLIQHEFGFFKNSEQKLQKFMELLKVPSVVTFHTVLPHPGGEILHTVQRIAQLAAAVIVMNQYSKIVLEEDYMVPAQKIVVIHHGTHLVTHPDKGSLKAKYKLTGRTILSTFGLLSAGKNIETTLKALPDIIKHYPDVLFLIIGKTHPTVVSHDGEAYRERLTEMVVRHNLQENVRFINMFLPLPELLEYLQLTDIYLFTSRDPNQAVSGTFSYAISCGCPVISTPIPHALEVLSHDVGIIIDFENSEQLAAAAIRLLESDDLRHRISSNGLHKMASTAWENASIAHALLFQQLNCVSESLAYTMPPINLDHVKRMTTDTGIIQFSVVNHPDRTSGYTLDDNARALIAFCQHYLLTKDPTDLPYITTYYQFIKRCLQPSGQFLNYYSFEQLFTEQNIETNLEDANGRAVWALGYLIASSDKLPPEAGWICNDAEFVLQRALVNVNRMHSTRAMAFALKGLYYRSKKNDSEVNTALLRVLADRLAQMYRHESDGEWHWFESYLTYANSVLPEAMLCAWLATGDASYKKIAQLSLDFLLSKIMVNQEIRVISNTSWLKKEDAVLPKHGDEQPIDVAYTIIALAAFYTHIGSPKYKGAMESSFNWFLGGNRLNQIMYNPRTGGCYDGLQASQVNLNQGAESTVCYLMARLAMEELVAEPARCRQMDYA